MIKKIIVCILAIASILSLTACGEVASAPSSTQMPLPTEGTVVAPTPTPTVYPETKTIEMSELKDYTIVYPAEYSEFRMDIVTELKTVIDTVIDSDVAVASDTDDVSGKKIILASAKAEHSFKTEIENFDDAMDYIVAVDGDNIVLGGKNYYADMRAMYAFAENNLGYTSYDGDYSEETNAINGVNIKYYEYPCYVINAATWATVFKEEEHVKDIRDCNFNMVMTHVYMYSKEQIHNFTKWCAKYDIDILFNTNTSSTMTNADIFWDCPMIYGAYIWDEPSYDIMATVEARCAEFVEKYSQYGWVPFVNYANTYPEDMPYALNCPALAYDSYIFLCLTLNTPHGSMQGAEAFRALEAARNVASLNGQTYWKYIQSYKLTEGGILNTSKAYRWQMYMDLCFGVKGTLYFEYGNEQEPAASIPWMDKSSLLINEDFSKTENYAYAQLANKDIMSVYEILQNYENVGAYTINKRPYTITSSHTWLGDFDEYEDFDAIAELVAATNDDSKATQYLVGCFENETTDESAFILMGIDLITDNEYGEDPDCLTKIKINGENPKFYFEGELMDLKPDAEGYYTLNVANGYCWLVTVE